MNFIFSVSLTLVFVIIYVIMVQIFTVLFRITGLTKEKARFQVISLLTNSGFTTSESEIITSDKTRRNLARICMITGTVFNVVIVGLLMNTLFNLNMSNKEISFKLIIVAVILIGLVILMIRLPYNRRTIEKIIERILTHYNNFKQSDNIMTELDVYDNSSIMEIYLKRVPAILKDTSIYESKLKKDYNIMVLLVQRKSHMLEVKPDTIIEKNDKIVVFGPTAHIKYLFGIQGEQEKSQEETSNTNIISLIDNFGSLAIAEVTVKSIPYDLFRKTLKEAPMKEKYELDILMIKRQDKPLKANPDLMIERDDVLVIMGPYSSIKSLFLEGFNE